MRKDVVYVAAGGAAVLFGLVSFAAGRFLTAEPTVVAAASSKQRAPIIDEPELTTGTVTTRSVAPVEGSQMAPLAPRPTQVAATPACTNPDALGVSRTIEIDTTGGPGLGMSQYTAYDFLQPGEIVLTFDDGPWPVHTPAVLAALAAQCVHATFFPIGKHSTWHPDILKQVFAAGHAVGSHTWSHVNLAKLPFQEAKDEIEKGISGVSMSAGQPIAPFFRFPELRQTPELKAYLAERNIATFSIDIESRDFRLHKPKQVVTSVMTQLKKKGKGIILLHDFQKSTSLALPELLAQFKAGGYKVVFLKPKTLMKSLPEYDEGVVVAKSGRTKEERAPESIFHTVSEGAH